MTYEQFTVVKVPFPFTDRLAQKNRPALILSKPERFNTLSGQSVMAMITTGAGAPWPLDCPLDQWQTAGLPAPSLVRFKLFTLDHRLVRGELGRLSESDRAAVHSALASLLGIRTGL